MVMDDRQVVCVTSAVTGACFILLALTGIQYGAEVVTMLSFATLMYLFYMGTHGAPDPMIGKNLREEQRLLICVAGIVGTMLLSVFGIYPATLYMEYMGGVV